jgi:flavin-dependent dehydrogenase
MKSYDAVIVGARVAGASTALLLARAGAKVLLLERSTYGSDTLSTHGLMRAGVLQLSRWGLLDQVAAAGTPPVTRTLFHYPSSAPVRISIRASQGVPALYAPRRQVLDRILVDAAVEAGAEVRHGVTVTGLLTDPQGRVIGVQGIEADRTFTAYGRTTIGADGVRSTIANAVEADVERRSASHGAVLYGYFDDLPAEGYEWAYGAGTAAGLIPTNDGQTCVFVCTTPQRMRAARRGGVDAAFTELFGTAAPRVLRNRLATATRAGRLHGWAGQAGHIRRSHGPGWALVGDAGYFRDPITTHGMTDALRDAELLADALLSTWAGDQPEAIALAGYQAKRDALSLQLFEVSDRIAGYDGGPSEIQQLLREVSSAMSDEVGLLQSLPPRPSRPVQPGVEDLVLADTPGAGR